MKKNLSIIIATLDEENNINKLFQEIKKNLEKSELNWEIIFVDDSKDNKTSNVINNLRNTENNIYLIKRHHNTGLSSALTLGALSSNSDYVLFIDADLQHPPEKIIDLFTEIYNNNLDLVSASRFLEMNKLLYQKRYRASLFVNYLLKKLFKINYSDVLTGFFIINQKFLHKNYKSLSNIGFKLLLDIVLSTKQSIKYSEIPFEFKKRYSGESKLNSKVVIDFITLIIDKLFGNLALGRYFIHSFIGSFVIIFQMSIFYILYYFLNFHYSLFFSIFLTIYFNFRINNEISYSGLKKIGKFFYIGLIKYYFFCSFGAIFNFILAKNLFDNYFNVYLAVLLGALVGSLWNNSINKSYK